MGETKGCSAAQLSLAWLLTIKAKALGVSVIPIPGTTKIAHARDTIAPAEEVSLTPEEMTEPEEIGANVEGDRADDEEYTRRVQSKGNFRVAQGMPRGFPGPSTIYRAFCGSYSAPQQQ